MRVKKYIYLWPFYSWLLICFLLYGCNLFNPQEREAKRILNKAGLRGGLIVHLACGDGKLTAALHANESFLVQGLDTDAVNVKKSRGITEKILLKIQPFLRPLSGKMDQRLSLFLMKFINTGIGRITLKVFMIVSAGIFNFWYQGAGGWIFIRRVEIRWPAGTFCSTCGHLLLQNAVSGIDPWMISWPIPLR